MMKNKILNMRFSFSVFALILTHTTLGQIDKLELDLKQYVGKRIVKLNHHFERSNFIVNDCLFLGNKIGTTEIIVLYVDSIEIRIDFKKTIPINDTNQLSRMRLECLNSRYIKYQKIKSISVSENANWESIE